VKKIIAVIAVVHFDCQLVNDICNVRQMNKPLCTNVSAFHLVSKSITTSSSSSSCHTCFGLFNGVLSIVIYIFYMIVIR